MLDIKMHFYDVFHEFQSISNVVMCQRHHLLTLRITRTYSIFVRKCQKSERDVQKKNFPFFVNTKSIPREHFTTYSTCTCVALSGFQQQ